MQKKFSLILALTAWLFATGAQWDLVQTFAWARMFVTNTESMPVVEAVKETFNPEARCSLCLAVEAAKNDQPPGAPGAEVKAPAKIFLASVPTTPLWVAPVLESLALVGDPAAPLSVDRTAPLLTPPRATV